MKMHDMLQVDPADTGESPPANGLGAALTIPGGRDVSQVRGADWIKRKLPRVTDRPRSRGFQAVMARSAMNDMHHHGRSEPNVEVCGVLVGNVYRDEFGPYLHVEANIRGTHAAGRDAQVTFTSETWNHINDELEHKHPDRRILGWYHTHPGFGIFLSEMDLFIHNNFFPEPWQAAYVYDPKADENGLFMWKKGQATRGDYLVDPDTITTDPPKAKPGADAPALGSLVDLARRVAAIEQKMKWLVAGFCLFAILALMLPILLSGNAAADRQERVRTDPPSDAALDDREPVIPPSLRLPPATDAGPTTTSQPATQPG